MAESGRIPESRGGGNFRVSATSVRRTRARSSERRARTKRRSGRWSSDASHVEREARGKLAAMMLREFGRASQWRAPGSSSRCCLRCVPPRAPASGRPRTGSARSSGRESSRARASTKSFVSRKEVPAYFLKILTNTHSPFLARPLR